MALLKKTKAGSERFEDEEPLEASASVHRDDEDSPFAQSERQGRAPVQTHENMSDGMEDHHNPNVPAESTEGIQTDPKLTPEQWVARFPYFVEGLANNLRNDASVERRKEWGSMSLDDRVEAIMRAPDKPQNVSRETVVRLLTEGH